MAMTPTTVRPLPERAEVLPGIWRLPLPLTGNPLGHVNTYLARTDAGYLLVDCGWDTADCLETLEGHLRALDVPIGDVRQLLVTHIHTDHYGMAGRLRQMAQASLTFHRLEKVYVESRYAQAEGLAEQMETWLVLNGVPEDAADVLSHSSMAMLKRVQLAFPDQVLEGGEEITVGRYQFQVLWTPGHSAGHICLYDARQKLLLSGDHVLPRISPSVGIHAQSMGNPLADYLDSLRLVQKLEAELVLPGHGDPFQGLPERAAELLAHHEARLQEIVTVLEAAEPTGLTGYDLATRLRWGRNRAWDTLSGFEQRMAVTETLAHTELLHSRGHLAKRVAEGRIRYLLPTAESTPAGSAH